MQGRGADHAVRESCDRARTGRGTASRRSTSESLRLTKGQVKDQAERQRGFDGNLGVLQLPSARADAHGLPRGDRFRRQPQGDVASLDQCSVVRRPVSDAVFRLYLGCTLDFTSRSCPFGRHDGQGRDEHLLPRTNAPSRHSSCENSLAIKCPRKPWGAAQDSTLP